MLKATTASGSVYEFEDGRVRRLRSDGGAELRRDGDWLLLQEGTVPEVGFPLVMKLEPLGDTPQTWRRTTPVVSIDGGGGTGSPEMSADELADVHVAMGDLSPLAAVLIHRIPGVPAARGEGN